MQYLTKNVSANGLLKFRHLQKNGFSLRPTFTLSLTCPNQLCARYDGKAGSIYRQKIDFPFNSNYSVTDDYSFADKATNVSLVSTDSLNETTLCTGRFVDF